MSDFCLYCHNPIPFQLSWTTILQQPKTKYLCQECRKKLSPIDGDTCEKCSRPLKNVSQQYVHQNRCLDCIRWENDLVWSNILEKNISLYEYNEFLKDLIARYKFRGDYVLSKIFVDSIRKAKENIEFDYVVPIPLSNERLYERGFNQSKALAYEAGIKTTDILTRTHSEKQSKKSRYNRIHQNEVFRLKDNPSIDGCNMILIDDIYTTGSTVRHAAKTLKNAGARSIISLTLARG